MGSPVGNFETKFERLEMKYLVDEDQASRIRRFIGPYCGGDAHNPPVSGTRDRVVRRGYRVRTLYLDSPSLEFHRSRERGDAERLKLRVRGYPGSDVVALEIKRRISEIIHKSRVAVHAKMLEDSVLGLAAPADPAAESRAVLGRFACLASTFVAQPTLLVGYEREAFVGDTDDYARITFDRRIAAQRVRDWTLEGDPEEWTDFDAHWLGSHGEPPLVMEIKCQTSIPLWMSDLIGSEDLCRRNFSKYSIGIHLTARDKGLGDFALRSTRNSGLGYAGPSSRLEAYDPFGAPDGGAFGSGARRG